MLSIIFGAIFGTCFGPAGSNVCLMLEKCCGVTPRRWVSALAAVVLVNLVLATALGEYFYFASPTAPAIDITRLVSMQLAASVATAICGWFCVAKSSAVNVK